VIAELVNHSVMLFDLVYKMDEFCVYRKCCG